jgi:exodeoxyribonuclease V beta subunit
VVERTDIFEAQRSALTPGITLVEASAGTGKTFAIAMLVLRAVAELGVDITQILVVTYTVAATQELRARLRNRLIQARDLLQARSAEADETLQAWVSALANRQEALKRLELALVDIDALPIHTIHGFCQRILREQILQSSHLFEAELVADVESYRSLLVQDFWRDHLYRIADRYGRNLVLEFGDPETLYKSIRGAEDQQAHLLPEHLDFTGTCRSFDQQLEHLTNWWMQHGSALKRCLAEADERGLLKKSVSTAYPQWFSDMEENLPVGAAVASTTVEALLEDNLIAGINGSKLRGLEKRQELVRSWPLPTNSAIEYLAACGELALALRVELARFLRTELPTQLHARGKLSFDELIVTLDRALGAERGDELASQVRGRFRLALIDEFQDTDAAQCRIFFRLFGQGSHYLYLIGDPKQAIYKFRGADINSYLQARALAQNRLTLDRNFRSHPALVAAVNRLFEKIEIGGAAYQAVRSPELLAVDKLVDSKEDPAGLVYVQLDRIDEGDGTWSRGGAEERIRTWVVDQVNGLIGDQASVVLERIDEQGNKVSRKVHPGDIGVLVRTNRQAEMLFNEFSRCNIPVVLSSRKSVFQTRECTDLLLVLTAVGTPGDAALLRTALSRDWFGLSAEQHYRLTTSEEAFLDVLRRFQQYHLIWQEAGLLVMMQRLLEDEQVYLNLSRFIQAERRIANIQHLVELIQTQQSDNRRSISQSLAWLRDKQQDSGGVDEAEIRLESDEDAVNVVTMHSAKGLEYQIVFCPFLCSGPSARGDAGLVTCYDDELGRVCDLGSAHFLQHQLQAAAEEDDEDLRLAYVAVTRARLRCYLVWAEIRASRFNRSSFHSALGRLLFSGEEHSFKEQQQALQRLGHSEHCRYHLISNRYQPSQSYRPPQPTDGALQARSRGRRSLQTSRMRTSFSGLVTLSRGNAPGEAAAGAFDEVRLQAVAQVEDPLPGGVRFGTMVHDLLECHDFADIASGGVEPARIETLLRRYQFEVGHEQIQALLRTTVCTRFAESGPLRFSLAEVAADRMVKEMAFSLHLDHSSTGRVNQILKNKAGVAELAERDIEGYLNGFIDLVCEHDKRFYIIDYKTNKLGGAEQYQPEALVDAMRGHNYGLQYWLYSLVVHRWLQRWLPGYCFEDHFGGVIYLFVRGMTPEMPGRGVFFDQPEERTLIELDRCFGEGGHVR